MTNEKNLTPLLQQYFNLKTKYKDYILLFRVGDFYESYGKDAIELSKTVDIVLTKKVTNNITVEMAGVPYHSIDNYLKILIEKNKKIAIAEQLEDPKKAKGLVKRGITQVITPGTITNPEFLDTKENNYLLSIYKKDMQYFVSYTDVMTRKIYIIKIPDKNELIEFIQKINAKEILIIDKSIIADLNNYILKKTRLLQDYNIKKDNIYSFLDNAIKDNSLNSYSNNIDFNYLVPVYIIIKYFYSLSYLNENVKFKIKTLNLSKYLILDNITIKNLEIFKTLIENKKKGSLLWAIDDTKTSMAARLLKQWILNPLKDINKINDRLKKVEELINNISKNDEIRKDLSNINDIERLITKISLQNSTPLDIINLKNSLIKALDIKTKLKELNNFIQYTNIDKDIVNIIEKISNTIIEDASINYKDKNFIKQGCNKQLDILFRQKDYIIKSIIDLEKQEKDKTGIKNLKIGYNQVFGYYIEVRKTYSNKVPDNYIRKQTLANAERYITQELKEYEHKLQIISEKLKQMQLDIFNNLVNEILDIKEKIYNISNEIAQIDIYTSFANISYIYNYTKPILHKGKSLIIKEGRHIVVERSTQEFIANDLNLTDKKNFVILTGPNMGGKSTYLRQNALIILLAHIGCFVPANYAKIPITDRIFSRVGASDDLHSGRSTYLVEMQETANILNNATESSFIILDEIGRGTSTYDGLSTAWAVIEYIIKNIKAKTLFATHFHELAQLEEVYKNIENYTMDVEEKDNEVIFLRKVKKGWADKSYGIYVAKLANMPEEVIKRANEILNKLNNKESINIKKEYNKKSYEQLTLFKIDENSKEIVDTIKKLDILNITPIQAINILNELKNKLT